MRSGNDDDWWKYVLLAGPVPQQQQQQQQQTQGGGGGGMDSWRSAGAMQKPWTQDTAASPVSDMQPWMMVGLRRTVLPIFVIL